MIQFFDIRYIARRGTASAIMGGCRYPLSKNWKSWKNGRDWSKEFSVDTHLSGLHATNAIVNIRVVLTAMYDAKIKSAIPDKTNPNWRHGLTNYYGPPGCERYSLLPHGERASIFRFILEELLGILICLQGCYIWTDSTDRIQLIGGGKIDPNKLIEFRLV